MLIYSLFSEGDAICKLPVMDFKKKKKKSTNNQGSAKLFIFLFIWRSWWTKVWNVHPLNEQHVAVLSLRNVSRLCILPTKFNRHSEKLCDAVLKYMMTNNVNSSVEPKEPWEGKRPFCVCLFHILSKLHNAESLIGGDVVDLKVNIMLRRQLQHLYSRTAKPRRVPPL